MTETKTLSTQPSTELFPALCSIFQIVEDPRTHRRRVHTLDKILIIALFAIAGGVSSWRQIAEFGALHADWFARHLDLSTGIPSHDTFRRVFGMLLPQGTQMLLREWFEKRGIQFSEDRQICIDGKVIRGASNWDDGEGTTNIVSAYCPKEGICLAQVLVPEGANEISTAPTLLSLLDLRGAIVTGDAAYTQRNIAGMVIEAGGQYCFALKGNQGELKNAVEALFARNQPSVEHIETLEKNRGRIERRHLHVSRQVGGLPKVHEWSELSCVMRLDSYRQDLGSEAEVVPEKRYYISSLKASPKELLAQIRGHWGIENQLHRRLDVTFGEDAWVMRKKTAAANLSVMRKVAGAMLSQIDPNKPLKHKQMWVHGSENFRDRMILMLF